MRAHASVVCDGGAIDRHYMAQHYMAQHYMAQHYMSQHYMAKHYIAKHYLAKTTSLDGRAIGGSPRAATLRGEMRTC